MGGLDCVSYVSDGSSGLEQCTAALPSVSTAPLIPLMVAETARLLRAKRARRAYDGSVLHVQKREIGMAPVRSCPCVTKSYVCLQIF